MREILAPLRPLNHSQTQLRTLSKDQQQVLMVTFFPYFWAFLANVLEIRFLWDFCLFFTGMLPPTLFTFHRRLDPGRADLPTTSSLLKRDSGACDLHLL